MEPVRTSVARPPPRSRTTLFLAAIGYAAFVVYGSLVPLEFQPMPLEQAWREIRSIPFLRLGIGSRADWVANILLFVPLGFLLMGLADSRRIGLRTLAALGVLAVCVAASAGIEFVQLFFPPRTVSQNDILAEGLGALAGVVLWLIYGRALRRWLDHWQAERSPASLAARLLGVYLAGLFFYNVLPLDLTISPVEIYHKWQSGRVSLLPFSALPRQPAELAYELLTDVAIWVPVGLLLVVSGRRRPLAAWTWTIGAAVLLETVQFFVYTRVTDTTDLVTAAVGGGLGVALGARSAAQGRSRGRTGGLFVPQWVWPALALLGWSLFLAALFWYPFNFRPEREVAQTRLELFWRVPFYSYYYGSEFRAATELLHKVLFFVPVGALLALGRRRLPRGVPRELYALLTALYIAGLPVLIELGQVLLPGKLPDSTDLVLEITGSLLGYAGVRWWLAQRGPGHPGVGHHPERAAAPRRQPD